VIEAMIERCAGIDVGKKFVLVCVMTGGAKDEPRTQIKKFGTIVSELDRLAEWLVAEGCTHAVMESTGSYWKPIFNLLEAYVRVILANAADVQNRRGHKTDPNDSRWLARARFETHLLFRDPSMLGVILILGKESLTIKRRRTEQTTHLLQADCGHNNQEWQPGDRSAHHRRQY
jgi:transposase